MSPEPDRIPQPPQAAMGPSPKAMILDDDSVEARKARLAVTEISLLLLIIGAVSVAVAFPFRPVKYGLIALFAAVMIGQLMSRPAVALAMIVFATPALDLIPPSLLGVRGLNAETILIVAALAIWVRANQLYGRDHFGSPLARVVAVYALLILLSSVNAWFNFKGSLFDTLSSAKNHLSFMVVLPVAFHALRSRRDQWLVVGAATLALLLNALQAIDHSLLAFVAGNLERRRAMAVLAIQPNTFGAALAMYLPTLIAFTMNKVANRLAQLWFLGCAGALAFALLLTLSRGAWLGLAAGLVVVAVFCDRRLLLLLALAGASYTIWVPEAAIERVAETTDVSAEDEGGQVFEDSAQMRLEQYKSLPAMMAPRPILGWGYKTFPVVFERYGTLGRAKGAHSSYCQLGTEGGVVGLLSLLSLLAAMAWAGWRANRVCEEPLHRWLGAGVLGGAVAMSICMLTGARFEPQKIFVFFWVFAGIAQRETILALLRRRGAGPVGTGATVASVPAPAARPS